MLHSLDARRGRLLTNSLYTQTSGAELHQVGSLHEGSSVRLTQPSTGEVPTASLEPCRFVSRWSSFASPIARYQSLRSRVASIKPHSLRQPLASLRSTLIVFAIRPSLPCFLISTARV